MKGKRIIVLLAVVGLAAAGLAATFSASRPLCRPGPVYDPSGTWIETTSYGGRAILTITPCDPAGNKLNIVVDALGDYSWLYDYFGVGPVAGMTKIRGTVVRTGRNTYQSTVVFFGVDADFNICFWAIVAGTSVQTGPDVMELSGAYAFYYGYQDPFGDEPPFLSGPDIGTCTRMPIVPPPPLTP